MPSKYSRTTSRSVLSKAIIEAAKDKDWIGAKDLLKDVCLIYDFNIGERSLAARLRQLFFEGIFDRLLVEQGVDGRSQYFVYKLIPRVEGKGVRRSEGYWDKYWSNLETDHVGIKRMIEANKDILGAKTLKNSIFYLTRISKEANLDDHIAVEKVIDSYLSKGNYRRSCELYLEANKGSSDFALKIEGQKEVKE